MGERLTVSGGLTGVKKGSIMLVPRRDSELDGIFFIHVQNPIFGAKAPAFTFVDPSTDSRLGNRIKVEAGVFSFTALMR